MTTGNILHTAVILLTAPSLNSLSRLKKQRASRTFSEKKGGVVKFFSQLTSFSLVRRNGVELAKALRWALFEKEKLENTLKTFVKWNQKLKDLVPHLLDSGQYLKNPERVSRLMEDDDDVNIFAPHLRLMQIAQNPEEETTTDEKLLLTYDSPNADAKSPRVLIEYKPYVSLGENEGESSGLIVTGSKAGLCPRQLANLLETAGSNNFRTLPFKGYLKEQAKSRYIFFFDFPPLAGDQMPQSLHDLLMTRGSKEKLSLELRFHVAHTISQSIGAFHADGWVHKSIRSHAVKFFFDKEGSCDLRNPFLTDFEFSRPVTGETRLIGQAPDPERDVYRHPERTGPPTTSFKKVHDIYSLGIVLLEIGLWEPARGMYDEICGELRKRDSQRKTPSASMIRKNLLSDASRRLGHRMGSAYKEAVVACLSDELGDYSENDDFAMTFQKLVVQKLDIRKMFELAN
ncbi:uncharacterized protein LY89DRAFT_762039 [Mollisia scopiformis]|uniref:Prion-inhibition and propagation HeLo domain-containing protein n=1 Tax=Mollisia scopiformis TaxID=149040 RepID=A0A132BC43_MOLSC|nr:uncharacterized protein LY89DRAFT_762039 [Mollisia scopiformis]KUJ09424.1 hypothetical protein LY89DRAFT_762039 [Mollisia scopiformis]